MSRFSVINPVKLDAKDRQIITALNENAKATLSKLNINLSNDAIKYRINRLVKRGVITQFTPRVHIRKFGYERFHLFFLLDQSKKEEQAKFVAYLKAHPHVRSLIEYTAGWEFEVVILAKNLNEFSSIKAELSERFRHIILDKNELAIVKNYNSVHLPYSFYQKERPPRITSHALDQSSFEYDKTDMNILAELRNNARLSNYKIAGRLKISKDTVRARLNRMLKEGALESFTTIFNLAALGYSWRTCFFSIKAMSAKEEARFNGYVEAHPYIIRAAKVFGLWNLLLYVMSPNPKAFHDTMAEIKSQFSDNVVKYEALLGYKEHIYNPLPEVLLQDS